MDAQGQPPHTAAKGHGGSTRSSDGSTTRRTVPREKLFSSEVTSTSTTSPGTPPATKTALPSKCPTASGP